jgi:hypothetical protein
MGEDAGMTAAIIETTRRSCDSYSMEILDSKIREQVNEITVKLLGSA